MNGSRDVLAQLGRTTDQIFGRDDLVDRLASGRPLRIKFGVDCTAPDLHLCHAVNLWMMRYLQDIGHVVVFLPWIPPRGLGIPQVEAPLGRC